MTFFVFPILQKMWKWRFGVFILIPSRDQKPKKKTSVNQKKKTSKAKEESQREAEERKGEAEAKEVFKEEGYEKQVKMRKEVRMMYSRVDWLDVMLDKSFIYLTYSKIFIHIFEGNTNFKNEYPVEIFWSMGETKKVMYLPLIMQLL